MTPKKKYAPLIIVVSLHHLDENRHDATHTDAAAFAL